MVVANAGLNSDASLDRSTSTPLKALKTLINESVV
jgi:hypothetical protein